jgi:hypothetical protein
VCVPEDVEGRLQQIDNVAIKIIDIYLRHGENFARQGLALMPAHARRGLGQEPKLAAQLDELSTDLTDGGSIVLAEIRDDFVIGNETAQEPHHVEVTARFAFEAPVDGTRLTSP